MSSQNRPLPLEQSETAPASPHLVHSFEKKVLCAIPVATLWAFGLAVFAYLNTNF